MIENNNPSILKVRQHLLRVLQSVFAAIFGIQSKRNMEKDIAYNDPLPYIIVGIVVVLSLVVLIYFIVHWIIK